MRHGAGPEPLLAARRRSAGVGGGCLEPDPEPAPIRRLELIAQHEQARPWTVAEGELHPESTASAARRQPEIEAALGGQRETRSVADDEQRAVDGIAPPGMNQQQRRAGEGCAWIDHQQGQPDEDVHGNPPAAKPARGLQLIQTGFVE